MMICIAPVAIDGDSIRCRNLGQFRFLGIDLPDLVSSRPCREGFGNYVCSNSAAASAAKAAFARGLCLGPARIEPVDLASSLG